MRIYEELFIIRPDATDEEVDPVVDQVKNVITQAGGTVDKTEKWGIRKLAYKVMKFNEGQYILIQFTAKPETVKEIERRLRVADSVLKFITVRIDEKLKRIEKRKKAREKRALRKPAAPAPLAAGPLFPSEPGSAFPGAPAPGVPAVSTPAHAAPAPPAPPVSAAVNAELTAEQPE